MKAALEKIRDMQIPIHASHACYFIMLSVFPTLTLLLGLLRYTALEAADLFAEVCPDADVNLINGGQPVYYYLISAE